MIDITILHWRISPYFICFLLSFVLAYLYVTWYLKKAGVKGSHIFYSELLNTVLALYFGAFYTFIVQLAEQGKVETFGFSSLGGMAGILLGVWIFTKISKEHKIELWTAYVLALGLMYAVSKLGCFFAGCCVGMRYQGPGSIRYLDNGAAGEYLFPVRTDRDNLISAGVFVASQDGRTKKEWYNSKESVAVCDIKIRTGLSEVL